MNDPKATALLKYLKADDVVEWAGSRQPVKHEEGDPDLSRLLQSCP